MPTYLDWVEAKSDLASDLGKGQCGGGYSDGVIILCTCISAMASWLWVDGGHRLDRKRFVELVTKFRQPECDTTQISVPLLLSERVQWRPHVQIIDIDKAFRLTGANDKTEAELLACCPAGMRGDSKTLRQYSYANILYEDIRCGFAHTYLPTDRARIDDPVSEIFDRDLTQISYVNRMPLNMRQIYFPLGWVSAVAKCVARGVDAVRTGLGKQIGENLGLALPVRWWVDG